MRLLPAIILLFLSYCTAEGQSLKRTLVFDCPDSTVWESLDLWVQSPEHFLLKKKKGDSVYFINADGTRGPFKQIGSRGSLRKYQLPDDSSRWYYKTENSPLYGPVSGQGLFNFKNTLSDNETVFIESTLAGDSIDYYVNGKLVTTVDTLTRPAWKGEKVTDQLLVKSSRISSGYDELGDCSNNGQSILSVENGFTHYLYVNGVAIDSNDRAFKNLMINDQGDYLYGTYRTYPSADTTIRDFTVINCKQSFRTGGYFNDRYLGPDGSYFLEGTKGNKRQLLINDRHFTGFDKIGEKRFAGNGHFLFIAERDSLPLINVDGKEYRTDHYQRIFYPTVDEKGNFSYYGLRNYYLYKVVNGREESKALSAYGVRAYPVYINGRGSSTHLYITDDSTYLYQDDQLLLPAAGNHSDSIFLSPVYYTFFHQNFGHLDAPREEQRLILLTINDRSYFIFEGKLSRAMPRVVKQVFSENVSGSISCSDLTLDGFFAIQRIGPGRYLLNINNSIYKTIEGIDFIFEKYSHFDDRRLVFNGIIGKALYQFEINYKL